MASQAFKVLYTKQLTRKLKTYNDGFVIRNGPRVRLLDDNGVELAAGRVPASLQLSAISEGVTAFDGFLVDCDEELASVAEVPRRSPGSDVRVPQQSGFRGNGTVSRPSPESQAVAPPAVSATLAGVRGKFRPPRVAQEPVSAAECAQPGALQGWQAADLAPVADVSHASALGKRSHAEQQEAVPARTALYQAPPPQPVHRSDEDILALLMPAAERAQSSMTPPAAKRFCSDNASCTSAHIMVGASTVPSRGSIPRPSVPAAHPRAAAGYVSGPSPPLPRDRFAPVLMPYRLASMQTWAALTMPSGDTTGLVRREAISDRFSCAGEYQWQMAAALSEELELKLAEFAARVHSTKQQHFPEVDELSKEAPHDYERIMYQRGGGLVVCHAVLQRKHQKPAATSASKQPNRRSRGAATDGEDHSGTTAFLTLQGCREKSSAYRKGDLWVLSNAPFFTVPTAGVYDRTKLPWVAVVQSLWHGPNQDGSMEVEVVSRHGPPSRAGAQQIYALHGPDASLELSVLRVLMQLKEAALPILPALLGSPPKATGTQREQPNGHGSARPKDPGNVTPAAGDTGTGNPWLTAAVQDAIDANRLNPSQADALRSAAAWLAPASKAVSPMVLIHGPFGSGKSTLLVSIIRFLRQQLQQLPMEHALRGARILVAAHTNTAVDRIMIGLLEAGCKDFLRIGSVKRMDKAVLPFSLHCDSSSKSSAVAELKEMLKAAASPVEAALIEQELQAALAGAEKKRRQRLKTVPIVGATCCATMLPVLDNMRFDIVMLDEATQMMEPLSLAALIRARAKHLIIAGDPCQLGPILATPAALNSSGHGAPAPQSGSDAAASAPSGLTRPLFQRLRACGHAPVLLRHQYRCHPALSRIPNELYYGGRLLDGCSAEQRAELVDSLPPLTFVNVNGHGKQDSSHSSSNAAEAQTVARIIRQLAGAGVEAASIGVICFYRAQVDAVQHQINCGVAAGVLTAHDGSAGEACGYYPQVATVDSFQGQEKDVIILTTVVTGNNAFFASDAQRLNVALTRARRHLLVVGFADALQAAGAAFCCILEACRRAPNAFWPYGQLRMHMRRAEGKENEMPSKADASCVEV